MNNNEKMNPNAKLSMGERIAYGIGDYSANLIYASISAFLLLYYTNVVGIDAKTAASIIAISKIFDGVSDLIMGRLVDRTHSKFGKARPWLLRLCVPFAVSSVLMFSVPSAFGESGKIAYMFITYNLVSTIFYTGINVPYAALNGLMTQNAYERGLLGNFRMILSTAGTMTVNTFVLKMIRSLGGGEQWAQAGWTKTYIIIGIATIALNLFTFWMCRERVVEISEEGKENVSIGKSLKGLFTNKYWLLMLAALIAMYFMMSCFYGSAAYFVQYVMGNLDSFAPISNALTIAQIGTMFLTPFIMMKLSKRKTMMIGAVIQIVGFVGTALSGSSLPMQIMMSVIKGIGFGCGAAVMFGLLQDAITYGQWKNGYGTVGMGNAASSFGMKVGSGIGTAALGLILDKGGFNAALEVQAASAQSSITFAFAWVPVVTAIIILACMVFFDLDKIYDKVIDDLARGRTMADS